MLGGVVPGQRWPIPSHQGGLRSFGGVLLLAALLCACSANAETSAPPTTAPVSPRATASTSPEAPDPEPADKVVQLAKVTRVKAQVLSGNKVRVTWNRVSESGDAQVRSYQLLDGGRRIGGHLSAGKRSAIVKLSYGTHCIRVMAGLPPRRLTPNL